MRWCVAMGCRSQGTGLGFIISSSYRLYGTDGGEDIDADADAGFGVTGSFTNPHWILSGRMKNSRR